jgi:hypothetical protein
VKFEIPEERQLRRVSKPRHTHLRMDTADHGLARVGSVGPGDDSGNAPQS